MRDRRWKKYLAFWIAALLTAGLFCSLTAAASEESGPQFTEEELRYIETHGALKVGYLTDRDPVSYRDGETGEFNGISRKIFERIAKLSGLTFDYVPIPSGPITYDYLRGEAFDLVTSVEYNEVNKNSRGILISNPYLSSRKVIVGRSDLIFDQDKKLQVAVATGSQTLKKVLSEQYPSFEIVDYDTIGECFEAVFQGEVDLLIQNQYVVEYWLSHAKYDELKVIPVVGLDDELCFSAVLPLEEDGSPEWDEKRMLVSILDKSIARISVDEITNYIIEATMSHQYSYTLYDFLYSYRYSIILFALGAVLVGILIFISFVFYVRSVKDRSEAKAKGQFLSTMSHEIRTPLNGLIGLDNLMERNLDDRKKLGAYIRQSSMTAQYLLSLVNDILDMSKLQEQKMSLENKPFSLPESLSAIETIEDNRMREKQLHFQIVPEISWPNLVGDETHVRQILLNLIDNAYKFTPPGGDVTVKVRQEKAEEEMVSTSFFVEDTGCGMSEAFQKKIFESFTQERSSVSKGNQGTGLGMAISSSLAKLMGGSLTVESKLGEGSSFCFTFPAQISAGIIPGDTPGASEEAARISESPAETDRKRRILIAEDNELNGQIMTELLESEGFFAELAVNGQEAIDMFSASEPGYYDCILMDMLMPVKDGLETTREIREMKRRDAQTIKIFACTANAFKEDEERAYESGMNGFLSKPVDVNNLIKILNGS